MKEYDFLFLTNSPAFYKILLLNEIAKNKTVMVVFIGYSKDVVNGTLNDIESLLFDYAFLDTKYIDKRNKIKSFLKLRTLLKSFKFRTVIYSGWNEMEFSLMSFFIPKKKNCLQCESTIYESDFTGIKGLVKKIIINRMSVVLASGLPHKQIFDNLNYSGKIYQTKGVGIFNKNKDLTATKYGTKNPLKYLYVGRLIELKNIELLINVFNETQKPLTIVGTGCLEIYFRNIAKDNVKFTGFIDNHNLSEIYQDHDVFILPSKREPWGLVVEEAIYNGLPVIVSDRVGCNVDLVIKPQTGCVFKHDDPKALINACDEIEERYLFYKKNVDAFDFDERDKQQVEVYTNLIRKE